MAEDRWKACEDRQMGHGSIKKCPWWWRQKGKNRTFPLVSEEEKKFFDSAKFSFFAYHKFLSKLKKDYNMNHEDWLNISDLH